MRHLLVGVPDDGQADDLLDDHRDYGDSSPLLTPGSENAVYASSVCDAGVLADVAVERHRAHAKHGDTSMENLPATDMTRLSVLVEEVGEVAREFNEARHRMGSGLLPEDARGRAVDLSALRGELIQVAAMATAWADKIER